MTADPLDFDKKYELIASTSTFSSEPVDLKRCRFCGREEGNTTFHTVSHAFSEFLGANNLISFDECDECNREFGKYESHLSKFFQPHITINGIRGKNGVPTFQSRSINGDRNTHTTFSFEELNRLALTVGSPEDYQIDRKTKTASIKFRIPPHKPLFVYKALVKIALSLLPSYKVTQYRPLYDWLMGRCENQNICYEMLITSMKKKRFSSTHGELFEARPEGSDDGILPELTLVLRFGNVVTQIFLPFRPERLINEKPNQNLIITVSPAHLFYNDLEEVAQTGKIDYDFRTFNLSDSNPVSYDEIMHFRYQDLDEGLEDFV